MTIDLARGTRATSTARVRTHLDSPDSWRGAELPLARLARRGLVVFAVWPVVAGILLVHTGKLWYIDRMVLLFDDVKQRDPEVASWEFGPSGIAHHPNGL